MADFVAKWEEIVAAPSWDEKRTKAVDLSDQVHDSVVEFSKCGIIGKVKDGLASKDENTRQSAVVVYGALAENVGQPIEPFLIPLLPALVSLYADRSADIRNETEKAARGLLGSVCPYAIRPILRNLSEAMLSARRWQCKEGGLKLLASLVLTAPRQLSMCLPEVVPVMEEVMSDTRKEVQDVGMATFIKVCSIVGNQDIEPFIPTLSSCLAHPDEVPECIHKLAATTFVQQVEAPTLSIISPLLIRGLNDRGLQQTAIKRKTAVIIDNMCKLVENPLDAIPFLPKLLPGLMKNKETISDPEARGVTEKAYKTLLMVAGQTEATAEAAAENKQLEPKDVHVVLLEVIKAVAADVVAANPGMSETLEYISELCCALVLRKAAEPSEWDKCVVPYLSKLGVDKEVAEAVARELLSRYAKDMYVAAKEEDDDDEGEDICNCEFKLAYGAMILLSNARLRLKRGRRYGLCGKNGCGKSTLMRAIANGQVEGFPPPDVLRTVYVEHDIQASQENLSVLDFVMTDELLKDLDREEVSKTLRSFGFDDEMLGNVITSLSGGWKMKLSLGRAILKKADILLLDEPTNHLDVVNVAWLENYLTNLTEVTSMIVSHDSGFLDNVCSDILHYESRKLKRYRGNLSEFVKQVPEAKSYYELSATPVSFNFPDPGFLEGVKNKDKAILKMEKCDFQYPNTEKVIVQNVTVQVSLASRVGVVGPNGAGKSTIIKLLTGENKPTNEGVGTVWKHPNLRIAYVAQHAFHHIENHLDKTPNEYIQWRYQTGEDREGLGKVNRQITPEEKKLLEQKVEWCGLKRQLERIVGRRKTKNTYEYEIEWKGSTNPENNSWIERDDMEKLGFLKLVIMFDEKLAAQEGLMRKPLTRANVEKHIADFGLEAEFATHNRVRGLSGGQKVKVVLAAAMWDDPQIIIMDEPTNYLDRDSLGALAHAIQNYGGGVVVISHNNEFVKTLCPEIWRVGGGECKIEGEPAWMKAKEKMEWKEQAKEMTDGLGNKVKVKGPKKKLSRKELKAKQKARQARIDRGEEVSDDSDLDA